MCAKQRVKQGAFAKVAPPVPLRGRSSSVLKRRPASRAASRSTDRDLQLSILEKLALDASTTWTIRTGVAVACHYKGQPYGPLARRSYRPDPNTWRKLGGKRLSRQPVAFGWIVEGEETREEVVEQLLQHASVRGVLAPASFRARWPNMEDRVIDAASLTKALRKAAAQAQSDQGDMMLQEFGQRLRCSYEGGDQPQWQVPTGSRVNELEVGFKWFLPDGKEERVTCRVRNAIRQGIPVPDGLRNECRHARCHRKAAEETLRRACPCQCVVASGLQILYDTPIPFQWEHVRTSEDVDHVISITYRNLHTHARPVPQCPLTLRGGRGFRYSLDFWKPSLHRDMRGCRTLEFSTKV